MCVKKCAYCDFTSFSGRLGERDAYTDAVCREVRAQAAFFGARRVNTVFFGGGTPTLMTGAQIRRIMDTLRACFDLASDAEITMEGNPGTLSAENLAAYREAGVNRLSLGVQSADDGLLRAIGRIHTFAQVQQSVTAARKAGFRNISMDLIYGLPGQTMQQWEDTLSAVIALAPEHISCYGLRLEEGTPMYDEYEGTDILPSDDDQADMYLYAVDFLSRHGFRQYEISNFARPGYESRHNLKYWRLDDYIGFGAAAASNIGLLRYTYTHNVREYISGVLGDKGIIAEEEELTPFDRASEYLMLGMRTAAGISREEYRSVYQSSFDKLEEMLEVFQENGWAVCDNGRWHFTPGGFLVSNVLIGVLLESQTKEKFNANPWIREAFEAKGQKVPLPTASEPYMN